MSLMTNPLLRKVRSTLRTVGINQLVARTLYGGAYESRLGTIMLSAVRPGDCVWDIGANIGFYTAQFADIVGATGSVQAFEPSPRNFAVLTDALDGRNNVAFHPIGLSDTVGEARFQQGEDDLGATSRIVQNHKSADDLIVSLRRGDDLVGKVPPPNVMKIDVEGHELEVLEGFGSVLNRPELRDIFIEVHFELLEQKGSPTGPARIEDQLRQAGFSVSWIDPSHLRAKRL